MKIVDADETTPDSSHVVRPLTVSSDEDTQASPGLRPDVLVGPEQQRARAAIKSALFGNTREAPTIGRYRVLTSLGEGAMGVVYAAFDDKLDRKVALKLLRGAWVHTPEGRERAIREARALARLSHPHVVHVYEAGEAEHEVYVAMEFLSGPTLRVWLAEAPRRWQEILAVFRQAAEGLAAAHRQGVIHRDFKPANAIFGGDGRVRVVDFGLAHFADAAPEAVPAAALPEGVDGGLTQTGAVLGTPAYMAPEQFAGRRGDAQSDQYSFCTALYEALYDQRPFDGDTLEDRWKAAQAGKLRPAPAGSDVPAWLFRALARGLQPDPAARWPSMDGLLAALTPPDGRRGLKRLAFAAASASAAMFGGLLYVFTLSSPPAPQAVDTSAAEQALAAAAGAADTARLTEARSLLASDPVAAVAALSGLESDDPDVWRRARTLAAAAETRGLPAQVLHAGSAPLAEVLPLAGGLLARDDLGAVWRWDPSGGPATQVLPPGSADTIVTARDAAVWAAIGPRRARVFTEGAAPVELGLDRLDSRNLYHWKLASDGRTLAAELVMVIPGRTRELVFLWDTRDPGAPRTIDVAGEGSGQTPVFSDDMSLIAVSEAGQIRLVRRGEPEQLLKASARVKAISADHRFLVAAPFDAEDKLDVFDLESGTTRRIEATGVAVLTGADVVFTRTTKKKLVLRRESLATGEVAWTNHFPLSQGSLVVDAAHGRYAAPMPEPGAWAIGELGSGRTTTYATLLKDIAPQWAADGALIQRAGAAVRVYRPDAAPLQVPYDGRHAALSPAARWAVLTPDEPTGEFARVELATGETVRFRCPTAPKPRTIGKREYFSVEAAVDDAGQVVLTAAGWNCWWDESAGARAGGPTSHRDLVPLARGVLASTDTALELWQEPGAPAHTWTLPGEPNHLTVSPSGQLAAVHADGVVHLLNLSTGADQALSAGPAPALLDQVAGALAWSPDGVLAVLDKRDGALRLGLWDTAGGAPRERARHEFADSPGIVSNELAFTPSGTALAFTDRDASLALLDLATGARRQLTLPGKLFALHMLDETSVLAVDTDGVPLLADFAGGEAAMLAPDPDRGFSSNPDLRRAADGSLWLCDVLGLGALTRLPAPSPGEPAAIRAWIRALPR